MWFGDVNAHSADEAARTCDHAPGETTTRTSNDGRIRILPVQPAAMRRSTRGPARFCTAVGQRSRGAGFAAARRCGRSQPKLSCVAGVGSDLGAGIFADIGCKATELDGGGGATALETFGPSSAAGVRPNSAPLAKSPRQSGVLEFGVFSAWRPGTRLFELQDHKFYAFIGPRRNTIQVVVRCRLGDALEAGYGRLRPTDALRVQTLSSHESLASSSETLAELYRRNPFDRSAWILWEVFWAPVLPAAAVSANGSELETLFERQIDLGKLLGAVQNKPHASMASSMASVKTLDVQPLGVPKAEAFERIYRRGVWGGIFSGSGPGSDPWSPVVRLAIASLEATLDALGLPSLRLLDAACGDAEWIASQFLPRHPEVEYTGIDIVPHVIEENLRRHPTLDFHVGDLGDTSPSAKPLPEADLVLSKETLNHMFVQDAVHALQRLRSSKAKYLLTNIHQGSPNFHGDFKRSHANYAHYDYSLPPFNLKKLTTVLEISRDERTQFALFSLQAP